MTAANLSLPPRPSASLRRPSPTGNKPLRRLFTSLDALSGNPAAADRAIRKLLSSKRKSDALDALSHLLSSSSPLAITMYQRIQLEPWFRWNPTFAAGFAALLAKYPSRAAESDSFVSTSLAALSPHDADLFHCALIESYAVHGLRSRVSEVYDALLAGPSLPPAKRKACEATVKALCAMGLPADAEAVVAEMGNCSLKPSALQFRVLARSYGKLGLFDDMVRVLEWMQNEGLKLDTLCCNAVISSYGEGGEISEVLNWLRRMRVSGIPVSVQTYNNAVTGACPVFVSMVRELEGIPLSMDEAIGRVKEGGSLEEGVLLEELVVMGCAVLVEVCKWGVSSWEMDLHGCHPGSAFLAVSLWLEELRRRFEEEEDVGAVREISLVCGTGRHSVVQGESPVRRMVSKVLYHTNCPLKLDRKNPGRFVAKGKTVKEWLLRF